MGVRAKMNYTTWAEKPPNNEIKFFLSLWIFYGAYGVDGCIEILYFLYFPSGVMHL